MNRKVIISAWRKNKSPSLLKQLLCDSSSSLPLSPLLISIVFEQIVIGAIIENTPAERDGRLRPGDELISVDKNVVAGKPHQFVIDLMHAAARNGQVSLTVRRRVQTPGEDRLSFFWSYFLFFERDWGTCCTFHCHRIKIGHSNRTHADSLCTGSVCPSHPRSVFCGKWRMHQWNL